MTRTLPARMAALLIVSAALARADEPPIPYGPLPITPAKIVTVIPPRLVGLITDSLTHTADTGLRVRLTADLGAVGDDAAKAELLKLLKDTNALVRAQAATGLANNADAAALIDDPSAAVRHAVVLSNPTDAVLIRAYDDTDASVRDAAFAQSSSEKTDAALAAHLGALDPSRQAVVCGTLAARKSPSSIASIAALLDSPELPARIAAIRALAALGGLSASRLAPQLSHPHPAVRQAAAAALAALPAAERLTPATALLADSDLGVRAAAVTVLGDVAAAPAVADLLKQFSPEDPELTAATRAALVAIAARDPAARKPVDAAASDLLIAQSPLLRCDGSFLLGAFQSRTQLARHVALLDDADWAVVKQAAKSLGQIGDTSAAPPLAGVAARAAGLNDPEYEKWVTAAPADVTALRGQAGEQAVLACVRLGYAPVITAVRPVLLKKTASLPIRTAGVWAIGILDSAENAAGPLRALIARSADIEEMPDVILEAIKAAGNAKVASLQSALASLRDSPQNSTYVVAATVSLDRINGTHTPIEPAPAVFTPQTTVTDLTPAAK